MKTKHEIQLVIGAEKKEDINGIIKKIDAFIFSTLQGQEAYDGGITANISSITRREIK